MAVSRQWASGNPHEIEIAFQAGVTVIRLRGEVDLAMRQSLDDVGCLAIDYRAPVCVDLGQVSFIDSTGLAFLARQPAAGDARGWVPAVVAASDLVRDVIAVCGLLPVLDLIAS